MYDGSDLLDAHFRSSFPLALHEIAAHKQTERGNINMLSLLFPHSLITTTGPGRTEAREIYPPQSHRNPPCAGLSQQMYVPTGTRE